MTATLCDQWPAATVLGLDSSASMIAKAEQLAEQLAERLAERYGARRLAFELGDIADWSPEPDSLDVIVANASLQWVPGHVDLLPRWAAALRPSGALAFQVPVSKDMRAGEVIRTVAMTSRWADRLAHAAAGTGPRSFSSPVRAAEDYVTALAALGLTVDAWETTYFHVLAGPDPVLEWFAGTGLRPYLDALDGDAAATAEFRAEVADGLRSAYPPQPFGTVLPFPRLFVVASK
jgi:trans-aconitate 2-methyltransferase